jgi:hypothetical protein
VIEDWIMKSGRTEQAFRNYLRDLGPEWERRFKAILKDHRNTMIPG